MSVGIAEVITKDHEHLASLIGLVVNSLMADPVIELRNPSIYVVVLKSGVIDHGSIVI